MALFVRSLQGWLPPRNMPPQLSPYIGPFPTETGFPRNRANRSGQLEVQKVKTSYLRFDRKSFTKNKPCTVKSFSFVFHTFKYFFDTLFTLYTPNPVRVEPIHNSPEKLPISVKVQGPRTIHLETKDRAPPQKEKRPPKRGAPTRGPRSGARPSRRSVRGPCFEPRRAIGRLF